MPIALDLTFAPDMPLILPDYWAVLTIIQEASNQEDDGMIAVGEVIRTRMKQKLFSDGTIPGTVLWPMQFSGWNSNDKNRIRVANLSLFDDSVLRAVKAWGRSKKSNLTLGATHYVNLNIVVPNWVNGAIKVAEIGDHTFYRDVK